LRAALNAHPRLPTNVAKDAAGPRVPRREIAEHDLWTQNQARAFLSSPAVDVDMAALVRLALDSGARIGELLALRWADLSGQTVTIRRTVAADEGGVLRFDSPKNDRSRRIDVAASTVAALLQMRERQQAEPVADIGDLMFCRPTSAGFRPWRPDVTTHAFQRQSKAADVPVVPFHHLRHACASWLIAAGMDVVSVSQRLGHWSPDFTLRVYSHAMPGSQATLARVIGDALT
jgi:integrase